MFPKVATTFANAKEVIIRIRAGRTTDSRVEW